MGGYGGHAEAKDENDEEYSDGVKNYMDTTPHRSSGAEVTPCQEGDGEGEENCYASKSGWFFRDIVQVGYVYAQLLHVP